MFTRGFRQSSRFASAYLNQQHRQQYPPLKAHLQTALMHTTTTTSLTLSSKMVSSLPAEVQQMLLELSMEEDDDQPSIERYWWD